MDKACWTICTIWSLDVSGASREIYNAHFCTVDWAGTILIGNVVVSLFVPVIMGGVRFLRYISSIGLLFWFWLLLCWLLMGPAPNVNNVRLSLATSENKRFDRFMRRILAGGWLLRGVLRSSWLIRANPVLISLVNGTITVLMLSATVVIAAWKTDCMAASFTNLVRGFINTWLHSIQHQCNCLYSEMRRNRSAGTEVQRRWNGESHRQQLIDASAISIVQALQIRAILRERCRLSLQQQERWLSGRANSGTIRKTKYTRFFWLAEINKLLYDNGTVFWNTVVIQKP